MTKMFASLIVNLLNKLIENVREIGLNHFNNFKKVYFLDIF